MKMDMTVSEQIADMGPLEPGQKHVFIKKARAPYIITVDNKIYYRGPDRDVIDQREDVAIIKADAVPHEKDLPVQNR